MSGPDRVCTLWALARLPAVVVVAAAGLGLFAPWPSSGDIDPALVDARPLTCLDEALTAYGDSGRGWTGGDSTWSAALPGGREVFAFSDTFLPPITPPTRPPDAGFVHNSLVLRDADGHLSTVVGGTVAQPDSLISPADPTHWYWLGAATYLDGALQIPLTEWRSAGPGSLDVTFVGSSLARLNPDDLHEPAAITPWPRSRGIQWGQWVQPQGARTYVYGIEQVAGAKYLHLARVAGTDLRQRFSYWTGHTWSDSEADSARITDGVSAEFSVQRLRANVYQLITMQDGALGSRITARYAPAPMGPFGPATLLYAAPQAGASGSYRDPAVYAYNAHLHPEFSTPTTLVVSYNVNSLNTAPGSTVYRHSSIYRPRFIVVKLGGRHATPTDAPQPACR
ncbi:DUF4185 domain-containing protein [Nocardia miyunensis]|uniref:DUF4185 domain-containing protein n=1 Tax=Nocardia miyunensis TaxID=282684 RepID=UPI000A05571A|nr:DUF4185 domain-containing protein [Nocardia miyunensis]